MGRKLKMGAVCAHIPQCGNNSKSHYNKVGTAFVDEETGSISIKLDTLPIAPSNWEGWLNIFKDTKNQDNDNEPF